MIHIGDDWTCDFLGALDAGAVPASPTTLPSASPLRARPPPRRLLDNGTGAGLVAEAVGRASGELWENLHHQGSTIAVGALAVPFLLRIATTGILELWASTLRLVAEIGRCQHQHFGDGTREGLLQVIEDPLEAEGSTMKMLRRGPGSCGGPGTVLLDQLVEDPGDRVPLLARSLQVSSQNPVGHHLVRAQRGRACRELFAASARPSPRPP
ncbi:hypothetical protein ACFQ8W_03395 [Streptomyces sp. NPDC056508]|uniref:hypothetical protein n=1 Tax=Streptomyces sp. NPDC056508 TaxID=3345845 RepID=UPI003698D535